MKNKPTDRYLDGKWSAAVKKKYNGRCLLCGHVGSAAHHMVKRKYRMTRWEIDNGVWVCASCHGPLDNPISNESRRLMRLVPEPQQERVMLLGARTLKDHLAMTGTTKNEWRKERLKEVKAYVNDG